MVFRADQVVAGVASARAEGPDPGAEGEVVCEPCRRSVCERAYDRVGPRGAEPPLSCVGAGCVAKPVIAWADARLACFLLADYRAFGADAAGESNGPLCRGEVAEGF